MNNFEKFLLSIHLDQLPKKNNHIKKSSLKRNNKINITVLDIQPIFPAIGGSRVRILGLYGNFDPKYFNVTYVGTYDWPDKSLLASQITPSLRQFIIPLNPSHFSFYDNLKQQIGKPCFDVTFPELGYLSTDFINKCIEQSNNADIVVFSHPWLFYLIKSHVDFNSKLVIYDAHNHEGLLRYQIFGDKTKNSKIICSNVIKIEYDCCLNSDLILTCSNEDANHFHHLYNIQKDKILAIPNGVFTSKISPCNSAATKKDLKNKLGLNTNLCCFIASDYAPNIEAVNLIIETAKLDNSVSYIIIGSVCAAFKNTKIPSNVNIIGVVSDKLKQLYLNASDIAINPMLAGAGTNVKMFDYMSAGLPIVTTVIGARGIPNRLNSIYEICGNTPKEMLEHIHKILFNENYKKKLSFFARLEAETKYSFERISFELGYYLRQYLYKSSYPQSPFYSIIIPTYNRRQSLLTLLLKLKNQTFKSYEIIIIDQSDIELFSKELFQDNIHYIHTTTKGATKARNFGAKLAIGKILCFIDDDCIPDKEWLSNAVKYFSDINIVGVEGRIYPDITGSDFRVVSNKGVEGLGFLTANLFVRKDTFNLLEGFDEYFDNPHFREDTDFGWRLQNIGVVPFAEDVRVLHPSHSRTNKRDSKHERNKFFIQDPLLLQKHPEKFAKLFIIEAKYRDKNYWQYFKIGLDKYNISTTVLQNLLNKICLDKKWVPTWAGGNFNVGYAKNIDEPKRINLKPAFEAKLFNIAIKYRIKVCFYFILSHCTHGRLQIRYKNKLSIAKAVLNSKKFTE